MIRVDAHEYILHQRGMYRKKKKEMKNTGFDEVLNREIQKLKGEQNGKDKNQHQYQDR